MSADYAPGTVAVATVRGVKDVRVWRHGSGWCAADGYSADVEADVTDIRPLVVLDLGAKAAEAASLLRGLNMTSEVGPVEADRRFRVRDLIADQIEAQTKPPRIPEPGLWGVVEASCAHEDTRGSWINDGRGWARIGRQKIATENHDDWDSLVDPTLIREGVQS